ncbi:hypothetical protein VTL71DRAFT_16373 [Oculimacula yallundae]|uniref:Uncharacterized protein n=1 Tax=Oculimacula yallundae TaxID=86028 RepID=A0ABR4CEV5_9HELO
MLRAPTRLIPGRHTSHCHFYESTFLASSTRASVPTPRDGRNEGWDFHKCVARARDVHKTRMGMLIWVILNEENRSMAPPSITSIDGWAGCGMIGGFIVFFVKRSIHVIYKERKFACLQAGTLS